MEMIDVSCRAVSKRYILRGANTRRQEFWALRDVSFDVVRGEALGIIGANGAGKSTLFKLLASITAPTAGEIVLRGRLSALLEVGSGFHPELTGRENVYLSGAILGMKRDEIRARFDQIVAFAGVGTFIDTPVKWYSSGMYVRLGFSISAHLNPDILLLDEVLAVGDAAFQEQCLARIRELRRDGTTALFISHDLAAVEQLCERAVLLHRGEILKAGPVTDVVSEYRRLAAIHEEPTIPAPVRSGRLRLTGISFVDPPTTTAARLRTGDPLTLRVTYHADEAVTDAVVEVFFYSADGKVLVCQQTTAIADPSLILPPGDGAFEFAFDECPLQPGPHTVAASCRQLASQELLSWLVGPLLDVRAGKMVRGYFYAPHRWRHVTDATAATSPSRVSSA